LRLTSEIESTLLEQIAKRPERAIVMPEWCYWKNQRQPIVYIDGLPTRLNRHLYVKAIGPLDFATKLIAKEGTHPLNVNPHLFVATPGRARGERCPNGHEYAGNEMPDNSMGWRCAVCYLAWRERHSLGRQNMGQINAAKTHCPMGHPYSGHNLMVQSDGRRRCRICNAEQTALSAARAA
jgi:hypothetical protein